jgi:hypothetical protein
MLRRGSAYRLMSQDMIRYRINRTGANYGYNERGVHRRIGAL